MPLRDHFNPPEAGIFVRWHNLHYQWAVCIVQQLNQKPLPERYVAVPRLQLGAQVPIDFTDLDVFEIQVLDRQEDTLVAAIELVSPRNKDRPEARHAFVAKCAAYLQQSIGLVVIDVVTERRTNLHGELVDLLELGEAAAGPTAFDLYAIAYRARSEPPLQLEMWPAALAVGAALPTLPLWIGPELAVPLDLEASYLAACDSLQIRR